MDSCLFWSRVERRSFNVPMTPPAAPLCPSYLLYLDPSVLSQSGHFCTRAPPETPVRLMAYCTRR